MNRCHEHSRVRRLPRRALLLALVGILPSCAQADHSRQETTAVVGSDGGYGKIAGRGPKDETTTTSTPGHGGSSATNTTTPGSREAVSLGVTGGTAPAAAAAAASKLLSGAALRGTSTTAPGTSSPPQTTLALTNRTATTQAPTTLAPTTVPTTAVPTTRATTPPSSSTSTSTSTTTAAPPASGGACPSGECVPAPAAGWRRLFVDEFDTPVAVGSFPAAVSSRWGAYDDGTKDTSRKGTYFPSRVLSVQGGMLDYFMRTENGTPLVAAPFPKLPGGNGLVEGRYEMRFRADTMPGYKVAALLWPVSDVWPRDGEIDFPEGGFGGVMGAYMHRQGATSGSDQDAFELTTDWSQWHTSVIERTSSAISFYLDGQLIGRSTNRLPTGPMTWVLQAETTLAGDTPASTAGHFQIDWVQVSVPA